MKEMKIKPVDMFATPNSWKEVEEWIERHMPEERAHLYTAAIMTWNLACKIVNEEQSNDTK